MSVHVRILELVGMLAFDRERHEKARHKASLAAMYVAPEARGRDVGRVLLELDLASVPTQPPA